MTQTHDPAEYGEVWGPQYDELDLVTAEETRLTVGVLKELAAGGRALELAAGTGRVAVPLAEAGVPVDASDASPTMVDLLRQKDAAGRVNAFVDTLPGVQNHGPYSLVALLMNSVMVMQTEAEQAECFRNVYEQLTPFGWFVVEMTAINTANWAEPRTFHRGGYETLRTSTWDPGTQQVRHTFRFTPPSGEPLPDRLVDLRYVFPEQLQALATATGFRLEQSWGGWDKRPFDSESPFLIAVFQKGGEASARV